MYYEYVHLFDLALAIFLKLLPGPKGTVKFNLYCV